MHSRSKSISLALAISALLSSSLVMAEVMNDPESDRVSDSQPVDAEKPETPENTDSPNTPSTLELHHARLLYRELYDLSQEYRQMLSVLNDNYGSPSRLASGEVREDKDSATNSNDAKSPGNDTLSQCPANAYVHYSKNEIPEALKAVRICIEKQREALSAYGRAMSENTDRILGRLSNRIQGLMSESQYSSTSVSSRKLNKGRTLLQLSLKTAQQAEEVLQEKPEAAIQRLRVARFQAIQGLILLENTYAGEQKLKKEFETALLDAEGKVNIQPLDESKYRKAEKEEPAPE